MIKKWWLVNVKDMVAQEVMEGTECPPGCVKVFCDDWRQALKELDELQREIDYDNSRNFCS